MTSFTLSIRISALIAKKNIKYTAKSAFNHLERFLWGSEGSSSVDFFKSCSVSALTLSFCITVIQFLLCYLILTFPLHSPSLQHIHDFFFFFVVFVWTALMKGPWLIAKDTRDEISLRHTSWYFYKMNGNTASRGVLLSSNGCSAWDFFFFSRLITYKTEQHSQSSMANIILVL